MKLGIVGLPNVGKSTLFNAITEAGVESANYPFCTIDPNVGVVSVPDKRLEKLSEIYLPEKITPAIIEFLDIAGLVKGASRGEGLGNKFLSHIREVDAICHVVRCFEDSNIIHVDGTIDSIRDVETINLELILSDLESVEKRIDRNKKFIKTGDKEISRACSSGISRACSSGISRACSSGISRACSYGIKEEIELLEKIRAVLSEGKSVKILDFDKEEKKKIKEFNLLTVKPVIYIANVSEEDFKKGIDNNQMVNKLKQIAIKEESEVLVVCAKIEEEISGLTEEEKKEFLEDLCLKESGLDRLIKTSYKLLGLISYLTAGPKEVRAWTIKNGTKAPQAAREIHTDFEKGFIRAEIVSFDDLINCGTYSIAREKGLIRSEGKEYIVQDGDIILFRFNV